MTITWLLATVMGDNKIDDAKRCRKIAGNFDHHGDASVQSGAHPLMKQIKGFTRSHWMPPAGECLHRIALAAAMVAMLVDNTKHKQKRYRRPNEAKSHKNFRRVRAFVYLCNCIVFCICIE
jgi:hypothetical protein